MEDLYEVLCEIRDEIGGLRSELSDLKEEIRSIRGVGPFYNDLYDVCSKLDDIESAINYK